MRVKIRRYFRAFHDFYQSFGVFCQRRLYIAAARLRKPATLRINGVNN